MRFSIHASVYLASLILTTEAWAYAFSNLPSPQEIQNSEGTSSEKRESPENLWKITEGTWETIDSGSHRFSLRGDGLLRYELCSACSTTSEQRTARLTIDFQSPAEATLSPSSALSLILYGISDDDQVRLTVLNLNEDTPEAGLVRLKKTEGNTTEETVIGSWRRLSFPWQKDSWYRAELDWRNGKLFWRIWPRDGQRPAQALGGAVFDRDVFRPAAAGFQTHGLNTIAADTFSTDRQTTDLLLPPDAKGQFASLSKNIIRPPTYAQAKDILPELVLESEPQLVRLFDTTWQTLYDKNLRIPVRSSPFVRSYVDEGFDPNLIFQWDTLFSTLYALYGQAAFDPMGSLDNFYSRQSRTGEIRRIYTEDKGEAHQWADGVNGVNPPLFAWVELKNFQMTGDIERVRRVLPALQAYADWVSIAHWSQDSTHRLYWNNGNGNGMDNLPTQPGQTGNGNGQGHVDMSSQMVLMWRSLAALYRAIGDSDSAEENTALAKEVAARVNSVLWDSEDGRYYEVDHEGKAFKVDSLAGFWPLIAEIAEPAHIKPLADALTDPTRYWTPLPFPTLAKSEAGYDPTGFYWRGGVWAPVVYATIKGLENAGQQTLAREAAWRYLCGLADVYDYTGTLWEAYAPEKQPGRWIQNSFTGSKTQQKIPLVKPGHTVLPTQDYFAPASDEKGALANLQGGTDEIVKPDFVGWSGLGPVALMIENIIGLTMDIPAGKLSWTITRTDKHGIRRLSLGTTGTLSLVAEARTSPSSAVKICVDGQISRPIEIMVRGTESDFSLLLPSGTLHLCPAPPQEAP